MPDADGSFHRASSNDRELSRASTAAFDDAASFFGAGGGSTSDGGYASSGGRGEGGGSSVTGGERDASPDFRRRGDGDDRDDLDDMGSDIIDRSSSSLYSRSLSASSLSDITDPLDDFLKRYTISLMPEETVAKAKKRLGPLVFGANYCPQWDARLSFTAKPVPGAWAPFWMHLWLHKLSYSPDAGSGRRRRQRAAAASFSDDDDDDDDRFVEPFEAAAGSDAASVGGGSARGLRPSLRAALASSRLPAPRGVATITSPKLDFFSWLRLQVVADADLASRRFGLRWRVSTKWSASPGRIGRKERWPVFDGAELKPRWSVDLYTPEMTGTYGEPQRRQPRGGRGGGRRRRGVGAAAGAADGAAGAARARDEDEAAAEAGPGGLGGSDDADASDAGSLRSLSSEATSFRGRGRRNGGARGRGRGRVAVDTGHCHLVVPRLDAVVDVDTALPTLVRAAKFVAVTPVRVLAGIPLAAARTAAGKARKRALPPPAPPTPLPPAAASSPALPFVGPGGLTFPPLPSFLSRSARFPAAATATATAPQQFAVRGWPWSLGLADGLESAAGWLRRATEEARSSGGRAAGSAASA